MDRLAAMIDGEIAERGPMSFGRFMDLSLYESELGFYARRGQAGGRRGDFLTSVESGPLFGAVVADWVDSRWRAVGQPARFVVAEAAAGVGTLWRAVARSKPQCESSLHWILVERSAALRDRHLDIAEGPWSSAPELPEDGVDLVIANELLDNLVVDMVRLADDGWREQRVAQGPNGFVFVTGDKVEPSPGYAELDPAVGTVVPIPVGAREWLSRACDRASTVLAFDYTATSAELVERGLGGWLRCYAAHQRVAEVLSQPGAYDVTADVAIDLLPPPDRVASQRDWLRIHGIGERVERAREIWRDRAHIGDLEALTARSAIGEADALMDPAGLGGFSALEWCHDSGLAAAASV